MYKPLLLLLISISIILFYKNAVAKNDMSVFGIKLGEPLLLRQCHHDYYSQEYLCWRRAEESGNHIIIYTINTGTVPLPNYFSTDLFANLTIETLNGKVARIIIPTKGEAYQQYILNDLTIKYGKPTQLFDKTSHNDYGAQDTHTVGFWNFDSFSVISKGYIETFDNYINPSCGSIVIVTKDYLNLLDAEKKELDSKKLKL